MLYDDQEGGLLRVGFSTQIEFDARIRWRWSQSERAGEYAVEIAS